MSTADTVKIVLDGMREIVNIRQYKNKPIPQDIQTTLFTAFSYAYSSGNCQPWEILVIEDDGQKDQVISSTLAPDFNDTSFGGQVWLKEAPLIFIVMMDKKRAMARIGKRGYTFSLHDIAFAIQNFRLMAEIQGLKTACVREFDQDTLSKNLNLPWYIEPVAIMTAGYGERTKGLPPVLDLQDIVKRGKYE